MGQLVHGHGGPGGSVLVEVLPIDLIVPAKVIHVDQEGADLHQVFQSGPFGGQDIPDVLDHRPGLGPNIQVGGAHGIDLHPLESIIGPAAGGTGNEEEITGTLDMGKFSARGGFPGDNGGSGGHG